jgi:hypothetical protein
VPALAPTNVGLIGALHEGGEKKIDGPSMRGGASIESDPATSFSTTVEEPTRGRNLLRRACFPLCIQTRNARFSTGVEEAGDTP